MVQSDPAQVKIQTGGNVDGNIYRMTPPIFLAAQSLPARHRRLPVYGLRGEVF